jgi:hypothetical protein
MPRKQDVHQSKYFRAADYPEGWTLTAEVETARVEEFQNGSDKIEKLVVYLKKQKSGLVIGPTVWDQFAELTGTDEANDWKGHRVELYRDKTRFGGKVVPCIRVRKPDTPAPAKKSSKKPPEGSKPDFNDEVSY